MPGEVTAGLKFGEAVAKLWTEWLKGKDRRKLTSAIQAGENYILCNEDFGKFAGQSAKQKTRRLGQYRHRFFKFNN